MKYVGFSTGCLYKERMNFEEILRFYLDIGADAVELSLSNLRNFHNYRPSKDMVNLANNFEFVAIHGPVNIFSPEDVKKYIETSRRLTEALGSDGVIFHPHEGNNYHLFSNSGVKFLIENLDGSSTIGITPEEFKYFRETYGFGCVLDLQHVYEHDSSLLTLDKFLTDAEKDLSHVHASGCNESCIHASLRDSDNRTEIIRGLTKIKNVPIIHEGAIEKDPKFAKKELEYLREPEKFI